MQTRRGERGSQRNERGSSVLLTALSGAVLFGMLGLGFDAGRIYIVKGELQKFADAAALAACADLDGTTTGLGLAHTAATTGPLPLTSPNAYKFESVVVTGAVDTYATSFTGTYDSYAAASAGAFNKYRFVNVAVTANASVYFLRILPGIAGSQSVSATATAGQMAMQAITNGGLVPFSPRSQNPSDTTNFGYTPNVEYTLKWGNGNSTTCAGDLNFNPHNPPSIHGYVDLGQGPGTANLRNAIVYGGYPNSLTVPSQVTTNEALFSDPGNRGASIFSALAERSNQDPDQTSLTWEAYKAAGIGNGRRIVTVPINSPALDAGSGSNSTVTVIGFGNFLLDPGATIVGNSGSICATYIGPANLNGNASGATDGTVVYSTVLFK